jgi:hypothetical protein
MNIQRISVMIIAGALLFIGYIIFFEKEPTSHDVVSSLLLEDVMQGSFFVDAWNTDVVFIDGRGDIIKEGDTFSVTFHTSIGLVHISEDTSLGVLSLQGHQGQEEFFAVLFVKQEDDIMVADTRYLDHVIEVVSIFPDYANRNELGVKVFISTFIQESGITIPFTYQIHASAEGFVFIEQNDGSLVEDTFL